MYNLVIIFFIFQFPSLDMFANSSVLFMDVCPYFYIVEFSNLREHSSIGFCVVIISRRRKKIFHDNVFIFSFDNFSHNLNDCPYYEVFVSPHFDGSSPVVPPLHHRPWLQVVGSHLIDVFPRSERWLNDWLIVIINNDVKDILF